MSAQSNGAPPVTATWIRTELYFGLSIPPGTAGAAAGTVNESQWRKFVDEETSPRFPDGLTVFQAMGQWRSRPTDGHPVETVHENSRVVMILHRGVATGGSAGSKDDETRIEEIRAAYKARFRQDSVMRTDSELRVDF